MTTSTKQIKFCDDTGEPILFDWGDRGCYADGALGHTHVRNRLADLLRDALPAMRFSQTEKECGIEALKALACDDSDDAWEEWQAIEILNLLSGPLVVWDFVDGDLRLCEASDVTVARAVPPRRQTGIAVNDDGGDLDSWFLYENLDFGGPTVLVRADSWESAYEIAIDELADVCAVTGQDEIAEAYGFYGETAWADLCEAERQAEAVGAPWPELEQGYCWASDGRIVSVGHHESLGEVDLETLEKDGWKIERTTW